MTVSLVVRGVSQRFGDRVVLDSVDLDVPAGRVIGLLGPNGAGKTTLMRIIFGVLDPDAGTIEWKGRQATSEDRRSWGYMPQERGLYRDIRVADHLVWIARLHGLDKRVAQERAHDLLGRLGLEDRAHDTVRDLSGGMAQRVQLAAAMVHGPDLIVLDEPFAGLDPGAVEFLSQVVLDHVAEGRNVLFSSHQLDLVEDLCETITLIDRGVVVLHGDVRTLKRESPDRYLRVDVAVDPVWLGEAPATIERVDTHGTRIKLGHLADAGAILDLIRAQVPVYDFGVDAPSLSELFLAAAPTRRPGDEVGRRGGPAMRRSGATRLVIARELRESLRRKAIWIVAAILALGSTAAVVLPEIFGGDSDSRTVGVVGAPSDEFGDTLREVASGVDIEIDLVAFDTRDAATTAVRDGDVDAAAVLDVEPVAIVMPTDDDAQLESLLRQAVGITSVVDALTDAGLTHAEIDAAFDSADPTVEVLDTERGGRRAAAFAMSIVLYIMLLLLTSQVATGVAIEKTNSVSEVLLAIVRPHALLFGKVIGVGLIGLFTLACGAIPVLVKLVAGGSLPPGSPARSLVVRRSS